jgi:exopolysaccharide biosynthesis polyprenyl glycosylphosphotransferase
MREQASKQRRWTLQAGERIFLLVIGDFLMAAIAAYGALTIWGSRDFLGFGVEFIRLRAPWFAALPFLWLLMMVNLYDVRRSASMRETLRGIFSVSLVGGLLYALLFFFLDGTLPRLGVFLFLVFASLLTLLWRLIYVRVFTAPAFMRRVLVIGAGETGQTMLGVINEIEPSPFYLVGFIDDDPDKQGQDLAGVVVLGDNSQLLEFCLDESISDVIVAIMGEMSGAMFQALLDVQERGIQVIRMPVAYEELMGRLPINHLESDWLLRSFVDELRVSAFYLMAKRLLDLAGAIMGLSVFLLIYPWAALAIAIESGKPIFLRQERLGQGGRPFDLIKFRTMRQDAEADGRAHWAQRDDPRVTQVGRILRKTHLDEFPQFWNVLKGDMSLVGPRPERPELVADLEKKIPFYRARLLVKPGLGGWAQVNYGKGASIQGSAEKLEYDLYYIKHRGPVMDFWILLRTMGAIIGFGGV